MSKDVQPQQSNSEEVDLGQLFKLIGQAFNKFFSLIGSLFSKVFLSIIWLILFTKKHVLKLVLAALLGLVLGFIKEATSEPVYKSYCVIKQNYDTGETLYNSIGYLNNLIKQKDTAVLKNILKTQSSSVSSITGLKVEPVASENEKIKLYDRYLQSLDSVVASSVLYKDFLSNEKDYAYKFQQLTVKSKEKNINTNIIKSIIETINSNDFYKREQEKDIIELNNRKKAIENSLERSDSLQKTYKRVLEKTIKDFQGSDIGITFEGVNDKEKTKEFDLYLKDIELRNEIVEIERDIADKQNIIEIISSKQDKGVIDNKMVILGIGVSQKLFYSSFLFLITFLSLLGFQFFKYIERYKDQFPKSF